MKRFMIYEFRFMIWAARWMSDPIHNKIEEIINRKL